jgi:hypothetical protein
VGSYRRPMKKRPGPVVEALSLDLLKIG